MRLFTFLLILVASTPLLSDSSSVFRNSCNAALSSGIRDNYFLLSERTLFDLYQRRVCDANFESYEQYSASDSSLGLSSVSLEGMLDLTGTNSQKKEGFRDKYQEFCSQSFSNRDVANRFSGYSSQVSNALIENWRLCRDSELDAWLAANEYGIFIEVTPQDDFSRFTVHVARKSVRNEDLFIESLAPEGLVTCSHGGQKVKMGDTSFNRNKFILSCEKHPSRPITFAIDTSDGSSNSVSLPAQQSKIYELQTSNEQLSFRLNQLESLLSETKSTLAQFQSATRQSLREWGPGTSEIKSRHEEVQCPPGHYVAGIHGIDIDRGDYCQSCISEVRAICRPLSQP